MMSLLNDTTCPTLVTTLSWVQALRHHYPFCHHVGRTFWTFELVWTLRPSLHHYRTSIGPQDMIKKLSAKRGKLIHAHESSAKPRKAHISYTFGATCGTPHARAFSSLHVRFEAIHSAHCAECIAPSPTSKLGRTRAQSVPQVESEPNRRKTSDSHHLRLDPTLCASSTSFRRAR